MLFWFSVKQCTSVLGYPTPYPIVEHSVLGHAVGSTELLNPASIVAVQHFLADAGAVGAGTPGVFLVTRGQVMFEEQFTAWKPGWLRYVII